MELINNDVRLLGSDGNYECIKRQINGCLEVNNSLLWFLKDCVHDNKLKPHKSPIEAIFLTLNDDGAGRVIFAALFIGLRP